MYGYNSWNMMGGWGPGFGFGGLVFGFFMLVVIVWTLYWKYQALWYAAKHDHKWWFMALLIINTIGILEIFYLYFWTKRSVPSHDESKMPMVE